MYKNSITFTSDLMNSYAWDTATLFLQTCGTNTKYSRQNILNTTVLQTGTNTQSTKDVQCNVYDMASNVIEWTTETSSASPYGPCIYRGGLYNYSAAYTGVRCGYFSSSSYDGVGFRPILYVNV